MPLQRPITPFEILYIVGDAISASFYVQLVLEMDGEMDLPSLNQAISEANSCNRGVNFRANLGIINPTWSEPAEIPSNPVVLIEAEWDGLDIQTAPFKDLKFDPLKPATSICYIKGTRHFIVFSAFHGLMDAMGLYHWVEDIFCALRNQPLAGSNASVTDYDFLKKESNNRHRPLFSLDCNTPTGSTGSPHTSYLWHKVTLPGKIPALTAKLCKILLDLCVDLGAEKSRFMIPVDLRSHTPDLNTTSNFANPLFIEAKKGASWQLIYSDIIQEISSHKELMIGKFDSLLRHVPLTLLKWIFQTVHAYQVKRNRYSISGLVSKMTIDLSKLRSNNTHAIDGYFLPINIPISPITLIVTEHNNANTICFSVSNAHATQEQGVALANQLKGLVEDVHAADLYHDNPSCDTLWPVYNNTFVEYPQYKTIFTVLWENSAKHIKETAFISNELKITTYENLQDRVLQIASHFSTLGVKAGSRVALILPRNEDTICSMLACWYLGAAYIPMDVDSPLVRVLAILDDASPALTVHDPKVDLSPHYSGMCTNILPHHVREKPPKMKSDSLSQLAYIIYTSGSTGTPKGVMINHGQLLNYLFWAKDTYRTHDRPYHTALFTNLAFDLTVTTLYLPLITGGSISIVANPITPLTVRNILTNPAINFLKLTPSHLRMVSGLSMQSNHELSLVLGGEALPCKLAKLIVDKLPAVRIFNEYGPTETTVGCMTHLYDSNKDLQGSVPIGIPSANTRIYCLDSLLKPVKVGQEGEIYIAGNNVGVGYLNKPEATNKSFLTDPFYPHQRMYRSGDLARHREDGLLLYLGRIDHQAKIRGYRIELSEIENALMALKGVLHAVVVHMKLQNSLGEENNELVAYIVSTKEQKTSVIRKELFSVLPHYMVPRFFMYLSEIPMTINGKVDETKLPKPELTLTPALFTKHEDLLIQIRQLFANALLVQPEIINNNSTFEEMGGDSIQMAYMISEILTKIVPQYSHAAFGDELENLLTYATPNNFYEMLSQLIQHPNDGKF